MPPELEELFGAIELTLRIKGSGKGLAAEQRIWTLQSRLRMKGAGKGKTVEDHLLQIETTLIKKFDSLD